MGSSRAKVGRLRYLINEADIENVYYEEILSALDDDDIPIFTNWRYTPAPIGVSLANTREKSTSWFWAALNHEEHHQKLHLAIGSTSVVASDLSAHIDAQHYIIDYADVHSEYFRYYDSSTRKFLLRHIEHYNSSYLGLQRSWRTAHFYPLAKRLGYCEIAHCW